MNRAPVFLVGASRCGNTLLQEALNRHSNLHISSETHWFDDERCQRLAAVDDERGRADAQDWFMSLAHQPFGHGGNPEHGWLDRNTFEEMTQRSAKTGTEVSRDHYFVAYCMLDAAQNGKKRWGEKTPRHVFRIGDILKAFPNAKIICALRDPRAMVASYRQWSVRESHDLYTDSNNDSLLRERKRSRNSYHPAIAALLWRGATRASLRAVRDHGAASVKVVLYEHLVATPEQTLRDLAEWIDEAFDPDMLHVPMINSSYNEFKEDAGFREQAVDRWQTQLSRAELGVVQLLCKAEMRALGYEPSARKLAFGPVYAIPRILTLPFAVYRAWRVNRDRTGNFFSYVWRRVRS